MLFSALEQTHCTHVACDCDRMAIPFLFFFFLGGGGREHIFSIHQTVGLLTALTFDCIHGWCRVKRVILVHVLCTPYNHAPAYCCFIRCNLCWVHVCLAVTCHLYFWQNDWDLLCSAIVVTPGTTWSRWWVQINTWPRSIMAECRVMVGNTESEAPCLLMHHPKFGLLCVFVRNEMVHCQHYHRETCFYKQGTSPHSW